MKFDQKVYLNIIYTLMTHYWGGLLDIFYTPRFDSVKNWNAAGNIKSDIFADKEVKINSLDSKTPTINKVIS